MSELKQKLETLTQQKKPLITAGVVIGVVLLLVAALFFVNSDGIEWREFSGDTLGFTISHPAGWTVEEENAASGPDILISDANSFAFVRIRGFLDPVIFNDEDAIRLSIAEYKKALSLQNGVIISDFRENADGFSVTGEFSVNDTVYRFEERGQLSSSLGQVIIMRAADIPENFDLSIAAMRKIMESFKQE